MQIEKQDAEIGVLSLAEKEGFEPSRRVTDLLVFEARPFNHLGIPPVIANYTSIQYFSGFV